MPVRIVRQAVRCVKDWGTGGWGGIAFPEHGAQRVWPGEGETDAITPTPQEPAYGLGGDTSRESVTPTRESVADKRAEE